MEERRRHTRLIPGGIKVERGLKLEFNYNLQGLSES
jgi:hypothetical protein